MAWRAQHAAHEQGEWDGRCGKPRDAGRRQQLQRQVMRILVDAPHPHAVLELAGERVGKSIDPDTEPRMLREYRQGVLPQVGAWPKAVADGGQARKLWTEQ